MTACGSFVTMLHGRLLLLLGCLHIAFTQCTADNDNGQGRDCEVGGCSTNWVNLWYVWLILVTIFLLLLCGTTASCIRYCCKKKKPPVQTLPNHPYEVTVIAIDNDSTIHSTVTSYSSVQYPHMFAFGDPDRSALSPPAYSLYALELPPAYEEAIKMAKPSNEVATSAAGPKLEDITEHEGPEEEPEQQQPAQQPEQQAVSSVVDSPPQYEETEISPSHVQ